MQKVSTQKGFNLTEVMAVIVIIGCVAALAVGMFNYSNFKNNTTSVKQAKISSALKSATMSILGQDNLLSVTKACDPVAMRDLYATRLNNAEITDNVNVNGKNLPAIKLSGFGIIAFESSSGCANTWHAMSSVVKTNASKTEISNDFVETPTTNSTVLAPVMIYTILDETAEVIAVPNNVTSITSSAVTSNNSSLTKDTMAFAVNSTGITNTYTSGTTIANNTIASSSTSNNSNKDNSYRPTDNTLEACYQGEDYSYISKACFDKSGNGLSIKFYEMLNESDCQVSYCPGNGYDNDGHLITSGQINLLCKLGTGNAGQCGCPIGKEYWASRYLIENSSISGICLTSCADLNMVETFPGSKVCECAQGSTWDPNVQKCVVPGQCEEDYLKWDEYAVKCVCKTEDELLEMDPNYFAICEVYDSTKTEDYCKRLRDNWDKSTGTCVCPIPFTQNGSECICNDPRTLENGICSCDINKVNLAEDEIFVNDDYNPNCKEKCDTTNYYFPDETKTKCIQKLPECECLQELNMTDYTCNCKSNPSQIDLVNCGVGQNQYYTGIGSCIADCNKSYKLRNPEDITECICPKTQPSGINLGDFEKYDPANITTCKTCDTENSNRVYVAGAEEGNCYCLDELAINFEGEEIYDTTQANCKFDCATIGKIADPYNSACIDPLPDCECMQKIDFSSNTCVCNSEITYSEMQACGAQQNQYFTGIGSCVATCTPSYKVRDVNDITNCVCPTTKPSSLILGEYEIYEPTTQTCKTCDPRYPNRKYDSTGKCSCDPNMSYDKTKYTFNPDAPNCLEIIPLNCGCLEIEVNGKCVCNENITLQELQNCKDLSSNEIFNPEMPQCKETCNGTSKPSYSLKACTCECLKTYNGNTCVCDPTQADNDKCINSDEKFDSTSLTCKTCKESNREYNSSGVCVCKPASEINFGSNEIYDPSAQNCKYTCKDGAVSNAGHTECIGGCLEEYNYETEKLQCVQNPSDELTTKCLKGTNYISDPSVESCKVECSNLTSPNDVHKECPCDYDKVTTALKQEENLNKIYDLDNSPICMMACQGQTFPTTDRTQCRPVDCLYETTDNITQHCIPNPSDELTKQCLEGTNYISDPSAATCQVECSNLTSPNDVHKECPCNYDKVTAALKQEGNLNKIYDLNNSPICMKACTGQTIPAFDRYYCDPVGCLYETTDNITKHCIPNPTDAQTKACLEGTNYISDPSAATCQVECNDRRSPNNVYKVCECDIQKMANKYSSNNMKFDATSSTCESACPSSFTIRSANDPKVCVCPATKPNEVTIQPGYYYNASSSVLTGNYACQATCPTTASEINTWISGHSSSFNGSKAVYDATKAGCIGTCSGNYIASSDKTQCICGINAASCGAGTYYNAASCTCTICPTGHYCPGQTDKPIECPCGTYGATQGLKGPECSGLCKEGYYCLAGSTTPTQIACSAGYICPSGSCGPQACDFPYTSTPPYTSCNSCRTEAEIRSTQPNYFGVNEVYVNNVTKQCKQCKSNMVYISPGVCQCPSDQPYWNGQSCQKCQLWGTVYFARQAENKPNCTLYNHMNGSTAGGCFDIKRNVDSGMAHAASLLSQADKNRTFGNNVYAYMVALSPDGKSASVVGVFTARSWYNIFPGDYSSTTVSKAKQTSGSCSDMCAGNTECVNTCNYLYGKISKTTMFTSCKYAANNKWNGQTFNNATDELCQGGQIVMNNNCAYNVGSLIRRTVSPLVLDLKGDGFKYTSVENGVIFDLNNDGQAEQTAWTEEQSEFDNAFLVLDKNANGQVDNGGELFGDQNGSENGFLELAKYDSNNDGIINSEDEIYNKLLLWVDFNKNGKVDYESDGSTKELKTLPEAGVTEISVSYETVTDQDGNILTDIYGNITGFVGTFKMMIEDATGRFVEVIRNMMDVFFVTMQSVFN